jgi:ABC-type phosphate transport system permease subunit
MTKAANKETLPLDNYIEPHIIGVTSSSMSHNGTKQSMQQPNQQHLQATISHLNETILHLNNQIKTQQSLQWITIFVFIMISIAMVYILKMEIQNSNSQYCIDNK